MKTRLKIWTRIGLVGASQVRAGSVFGSLKAISHFCALVAVLVWPTASLAQSGPPLLPPLDDQATNSPGPPPLKPQGSASSQAGQQSAQEVLAGTWQSDETMEVIEGIGLVPTTMELTFWKNGDALIVFRYAPGSNTPMDRRELNGTYQASLGSNGRIGFKVTGTITNKRGDKALKHEEGDWSSEWSLLGSRTAQDNIGLFHWRGETTAAKPPMPDPKAKIELQLPEGTFVAYNLGFKTQDTNDPHSLRTTIKIGPGSRYNQHSVLLGTKGRRDTKITGIYEVKNRNDKKLSILITGEMKQSQVVVHDALNSQNEQSGNPIENPPPALFPERSELSMPINEILEIEIVSNRKFKIGNEEFEKIN